MRERICLQKTQPDPQIISSEIDAVGDLRVNRDDILVSIEDEEKSPNTIIVDNKTDYKSFDNQNLQFLNLN